MESPIKVVEDTVETVIDDVEGIFTAKPGGMVDRHRKERARREAAQKEAENIAERVEEPTYKAVKTARMRPETFSTNTFNIGPGSSAQILPLSPYRDNAKIICNTPEQSVVLAKDSSAALGGVGFPLPPGIVFPVTARAQLWAYNPNAITVQVCVLVELNAPEM